MKSQNTAEDLPRPIDDLTYLSLFDNAREIFDRQRFAEDDVADLEANVDQILEDRDPDQGLSLEAAARLLQLLRNNRNEAAWLSVLEAAREARQSAFGRWVAPMVPVEVTSYCASTCKFCGWRADNKDMVRLAITETAIRGEARILARMGFSHFEIAGGDDLAFLRNNLKGLIRGLKEETRAVNPESRVSLCLVPMAEEQYAGLKEVGLDCVLTWQETYDQALFNEHIPSGPKARGVDLDFKVVKGGNGFLERLKSQERAIRCGLQAGLGAMLGLSKITEVDVLSVISHGRALLDHYGSRVQPLIIGMPAWNPITTPGTDNREAYGFNFDVEGSFEMVAAIYLLSFPNRRAWVFANGRVSPAVQTNVVVSAAPFTSTLVQIAPGAYLGLGEDKSNELARDDLFSRTSLSKAAALDRETILSGEQFQHYLMSHDEFVELFLSRGLELVSDQSLLTLCESARTNRDSPAPAGVRVAGPNAAHGV